MPYELYHHGTPGMHWGVRRYQNTNGTLTRAGMKRFKKVSKSKRESRKVTNDAIKILSKELKRTNRKANSYSKRDSEKGRQYIESSKVLNKRLNGIKSGELKAGKDFVTVNSSIKIPYVYVGMTGPRMGSFSKNKKHVIFK